VLINIAKAKRTVLDLAAQRAKPKTRVSAELWIAANAMLIQWLKQTVEKQPSSGKTIYPLVRTM